MPLGVAVLGFPDRGNRFCMIPYGFHIELIKHLGAVFSDLKQSVDRWWSSVESSSAVITENYALDLRCVLSSQICVLVSL